MKLLSTILALIIFALSAKPCSDGQHFEDSNHEESSIGHNHEEEHNDDSCSITCICNCCGMSITYEPLATFELIFYTKISTHLISTYEPIYRFDFHSNIWQPPKIIG